MGVIDEERAVEEHTTLQSIDSKYYRNGKALDNINNNSQCLSMRHITTLESIYLNEGVPVIKIRDGYGTPLTLYTEGFEF